MKNSNRILTTLVGSLPRPEGLQDMASQFVEIGQRFRTGRAPTDLGSTLTLPLVRPGGVDSWTFDIFAHEMVQTPRMGELETVRVTPRPYQGRRGTLASEFWFAPRLQYLPVRMQVLVDADSYALMVMDGLPELVKQPLPNSPAALPAPTDRLGGT